MADKKEKTVIPFVLNDETEVNSYGMRVRNAYLDTARFEKNPVMLYNHEWRWEGEDAVIGRWENLRIEGDYMVADAVFDTGSVRGAEISRKVEEGFIKGASIGFYTKYVGTVNGIDENGGVLLEASITPLPANGNAVKLYAEDCITQLSEEQIKLSLNNHNKTMESNKENPVNKALEAENIQLKAENDQLKAALNSQKELAAKSFADKAVKDGKISAEQQEEWQKLHATNAELAEKTLGAIPARTSLNAQIGNAQPEKTGLPKTLDELCSLSEAQIKAFEASNPQEYSKIMSGI